MKLLLLSPNFHPEMTGIGRYSGEMASWLVARGHQVRVICAPPHYPAWRIGGGYSGWRYETKRWQGVSILRCPLYVPPRPGGLRRLLHLASFAMSSLLPTLFWAWRWRPDVVMVIEPPLACAPAALLAARLAGARAWLHVQDLEVDAAFELGILASPRLHRWLLAMERKLLRRFERITSISARMLTRLVAKGVDVQRLGFFPNWVDLTAIHPVLPSSGLRESWGLTRNEVVCLYSGSLGAKQGLEILVEVARLLPADSPVVFVVCGEGPALGNLRQLTAGRTDFRFLPLQPAERFNELLGTADIHLLPQRAGAEGLVMPSKLTGMLASGRAVVAAASVDSDVDIALRDCGCVVAPGDAIAMAAAIVRLAQSPELRSEFGIRARERALALWDRDRILEEAFDVTAMSSK